MRAWLLKASCTADGVATIRVLRERILQSSTEAEATEVVGAAPGEHPDRRKGHHERLPTTQVSDPDP